jgi:hypothetical protein
VPLPEKGVEHYVAARRTVEDRGGDHRDRLHGRMATADYLGR